MKDFELLTIMLTEDDYIEVYPVGLETVFELVSDGDYAKARLSWVQAQQLYRWLRERLGE